MTVLGRTRLDGFRGVLDGRPQREVGSVRGLKGTENPRVGGSIPPLGTNNTSQPHRKFLGTNRFSIATVLRRTESHAIS